MARINTNVSSLIARSNLARNNALLDTRLERLSTGLRINRGRDDPAGIIISQRITTDLGGITAAISNTDRAGSVIATTEGSLSEVSSLLNDIKGLLVQSANVGGNSAEERKANQIQIDSAIDSITRIANSASFGGLQLLNGSLDFVTSGVANSAISTSQIFSASFVGSQNIAVDVDVIASAQQALLFMNGNTGISTGGVINSSFTVAVEGSEGQVLMSFVSGQSMSQIISSVNSQSSSTGVEAALIDPTNSSVGLMFKSTGFGSNSFISVNRINLAQNATDTFSLSQFDGDINLPSLGAGFWSSSGLITNGRDEGRDVTALINGSLARSDGFEISINSPTLSLELLLNKDFATDPTSATSSFNVTGGGSLFQIGPDINAQQQASIGIQSVVASELGGTLTNGTVQFLSSLKEGEANSIENSNRGKDFTAAQSILDSAIDDISILRGRLGAFERNVLGTAQRSLQSQFENLTASKSRIVDADFAVETSELTRAQILQSSGTSVLSLANQSAQSVLQLLG